MEEANRVEIMENLEEESAGTNREQKWWELEETWGELMELGREVEAEQPMESISSLMGARRRILLQKKIEVSDSSSNTLTLPEFQANDNRIEDPAPSVSNGDILILLNDNGVSQEISGWILLSTNVILEMASAIFDQLGYALIGMVLAFVALVLATIDLLHVARKERIKRVGRSLLPSANGQSTYSLAPGKPPGTIFEYFGLAGALWQCFYSTVEYTYALQKKDSPIKMCLLPFIFLLCVVISKSIKRRSIDNNT